MNKIKYDNISYEYKNKIIFNNVSFRIKEHSITSLIGDNGVGKTTLLKLLHKINYQDKKYVISSALELASFYPFLTGYENLKYYCIIENINYDKIEKVLDTVGLTKQKNILFKNYSLGMKQKLNIARCLMKDADIYMFDEPFNALDPKSIVNFRKILFKLKKDKKTVIISSHILKELDEITDEILYIKNNNIYEINNNIKGKYYYLKAKTIPILLNKYKINNNEIKFDNNEDLLNKILNIFIFNKIKINEIYKENESIERILLNE